MNDLYFQRNKEKLYNIISASCQYTKYYSKKIRLPSFEDFTYEFFKQIPIIDKKIVLKKSNDLFSSKCTKSNLLCDTTSGTNGKPLNCYKSNKERCRLGLELWGIRRRYYKISPKSKVVRFFAFRNKDGKMKTTTFFNNNELYISLFDFSTDAIKDILKMINEFNPEWLIGPPTAISLLAIAQKEFNILKRKIPFIELNGELVDCNKFSVIKNLGCIIANHYGSREFWCIAYGLANEKLSINSNSVFVESIYNNQINEYELIITTLNNYDWPLIRYKIGDIGIVEYKNDRPYLMLKNGRVADYFLLSNNKYINAIIFSSLARSINESNRQIIIKQFQAQFIKNENKIRILLIVNDNNYKNFVHDFYTKKLKEILGNVAIDIVYVEKIPFEVSGKSKDFIII